MIKVNAWTNSQACRPATQKASRRNISTASGNFFNQAQTFQDNNVNYGQETGEAILKSTKLISKSQKGN